MGECCDGGSSPLCILCCYSFPRPSREISKEDPSKREKVVDKFIQQTGVEDLKCLSSEGLLASEQVSICEDCLSVIAKAVERREQVEEVEVTVRQLQVEILRMMRQLGELMEGYLEEMRDIEDKIRSADEACLRLKFGARGGRRGKKGEWTKKNVLLFRGGILNVVTGLSAFRTDLLSKTVGPPEGTFGNTADDIKSAGRREARVTVPNQVNLEKEDDHDSSPAPEPETSDSEWVYPKPSSKRNFPRKSRKTRHHPVKIILLRKQDEPEAPDDAPMSNAIAEVSSKSNPSPSSVNTHGPRTRRRHRKPKQCPHCLKWICYFGLKRHIQTHLPAEQRPKFKCPDCGSFFRSQSFVSIHQARHCFANKSNWPFVCVHCSKRCFGALSLSRHLESVHGDTESAPKFTCTQCPRVFRAAFLLKAHELTHRHRTPKPPPESCKCEFCGKILRKDSRSTHVKRHCPARPNKDTQTSVVCHRCGKTVSSKEALSAHLKITCVDSKNLQCRLCGKGGFKTDRLLASHENRHEVNALRPYMCSLCGGSFNCSGHLKRHGRKCDGTKKPRKPRWSNMLPAVHRSPEDAQSSGGGR